MRLTLTFLFLLLTTPCIAAPKIVVSIAPIYSLVSAITEGISQPQLLLSQGGSPHSASLRPSQARAMTEADLMIWIGPELESFLTLPVARLLQPDVEMSLLKLKNLNLLEQRHGGFWEEDHHTEETAHDSQSINPHIWLSPENARQIVTSVCERLIQIDPQNSKRYTQNLAALLKRIDQLELSLHEKLASVRSRPYLVFHDAYPYLEEAFSLNAIGSIRVSAERAPGARRLQEIRTKARQSAAICLFSEPQFSPVLAESLAKETHLKLGVLDPLGNTLNESSDGWFTLMERLAENLVNCLDEGER
jgi:zinc transport system substrate-binding protein